jgi:hypothetical protein
MNLHQKFLQLAAEKNKITYKMVQLLPEIYKSGLYLKYAHTIQGYALRYGGIPESTVNKILKLDQRLSGKPLLKQAIATVGVHKVAMVANLVTKKNEALFVEKLQTMSSSAIQQMSKELRGNTAQKILTINLTPELQKLWDAARKQFGSEDDAVTLYKVLSSTLQNLNTEAGEQTSGRHIPTKLKQKTFKQYNNLCAYPNCQKPAVEIHHPDRFALKRNHQKLIPLCKNHHQFAHHTLIKNEQLDPWNWNLQLQKTTNLIDLKYQKFRC